MGILSNAIGNIIHFLSLEVIIQVAQGLDTKSTTVGGRGRGKAHPPVRNPSPRTENLALFGEWTWMVLEPFAHDTPEANHNPVGRIYYSIFTMVCTPAVPLL